jgi:hypothetical protein
MDPDREALSTAIKLYSYEAIKGPWLSAILDAARRDLARMEAEAPKRATLEEMARDVAECDCRSGCVHEQTAAVLRKLKEFKDEVKTYHYGEWIGTRLNEFLNSLP